MRTFSIQILYFLFFQCLITYAVQGQEELSSQAELSVLTCDPGNELYSTFGHTGIRVNDPAYNLDIVFNYGMFSFKTPGFYRKFLRGKLDYHLGIQKYGDFLREYNYYSRSVYEQKLNLDSIQRQQVFAFLKNNAKKENRTYKYDFFFDNCSTRPRDVFVNSLGIEFHEQAKEKTFRNLLDEFLPGLPWSDFGIDLVIGSRADKKAISKEQKQRFTRPWLTPMLFFVVLLLLEILLFFFVSNKNRWLKFYDKLWFLLMGLSSLLLFVMWFFTDHIATKANWNLLWIHPLYLILAFRSRTTAPKIILILSFVLTASALVFWLLIPQQLHLAFVPIILLLLMKLLRWWKIEHV